MKKILVNEKGWTDPRFVELTVNVGDEKPDMTSYIWLTPDEAKQLIKDIEKALEEE